jgi:hypothetical protein
MNFLDVYSNINLEDFLLLGIVYNFVKIVVVCLFNEILWLTQMFNKKNNIKQQTFKIRFFYENFLKLRTYSYKFNIFYIFIFFKN